MSNHNSETSKLWKQRHKSQEIIADKAIKRIEALEERQAFLMGIIIGVSNIAQLNEQLPSRSNMTDIINLVDGALDNGE
jgi:hypothetical protein